MRSRSLGSKRFALVASVLGCSFVALAAGRTTPAVNQTAGVNFRNAGSNPESYSASAPVIGTEWQAMVDLTTTGHAFAQLVGFDSPAQITLPGDRVILVGGAKLATLGRRAGPLATWSESVPNDPGLVGRTLYTQAIHMGAFAQKFALSNALDLVFGS